MGLVFVLPDPVATCFPVYGKRDVMYLTARHAARRAVDASCVRHDRADVLSSRYVGTWSETPSVAPPLVCLESPTS